MRLPMKTIPFTRIAASAWILSALLGSVLAGDVALPLTTPASGADATRRFNYSEALQKALYFYEAQQSGALSPNNRVEWRGPACLTDGQDIGRDLSGGWFDAGDHWTANLTMSFAAMTLAWSAIEHPEGWLKTGQMDELLEGLIHVNRYFLKCVLNANCKDPAAELEVVIGCGGKEGVGSPNVHSMWAPAEVAHLMTKRPTFRLNKQAPGGDIPGAMAAAMAASSMVIREHAAVLRRIRGYNDFNGAAFADMLLDRAEKLVLFARANSGPVLTDALPKEEQARIRKARNSALRGDGKAVEVGYRADPFDKVFTAATFLQRAHVAKNPQCGPKWFDFANEVYEREYKAESNDDWWKDYGAGNFGKLGAYNMMRLAPDEETFHAELQLYCVRFAQYDATPGGLRLREKFAHEYGSLRHANNAAVIALYYSEHVEKSPALKGNTWWKGVQSNTELRELFTQEAKRQVDYALGANPYGRSYLVGFGNQPFNHIHHRGAYGAWAGFEHFINGKADNRTTNRHLLYGALVAGPDHHDVFLCGKESRQWLPTGTNGHDFYYKFPNRPEPVRKTGYVWSTADQPVQDVMDSQFNEVALDYNAGFTASLAWLCAHGLSNGRPLPETEFPPKIARNETLDLSTTDREFFVATKRIGNTPGAIEIEATLWNRSRWPSRVSTNLSFRHFFTLDGDTSPDQVQSSVMNNNKAKISPAKLLKGKTAFIEVGFPGVAIYPGNLELASRSVRLRLTAPIWDDANDWSADGLSAESKLQPRCAVYDDGKLVGGVEP
jgi:endoglucanase